MKEKQERSLSELRVRDDGKDDTEMRRHDAPLSRRRFVQVAATGAAAVGAMALAGCTGLDAALLHSRVITDDAMRELEIPTPDTIRSVFFTSGLAQVYVCALAPDLLGGTAYKYTTEEELEFLPEGIENLPYLGTLNNNSDEIDREALLAEDFDLIFSISGVELTQQNISEADEIQRQTGIPVVCIDGSFDKVGHAFRTLGDILGRESRAEELALYVDSVYAEVSTAVSGIPMEERIPLYYAEGPEGLHTEPETSQHMLAFLEAGALDVADCEQTYGGGMTPVSLEQVLKWNPEVIIAWSSSIRGGAANEIKTSSRWSSIRAVEDGRVYTMPNLPWAWCDRPPGVNRIMGLMWVANLLYPEQYDVDIVEKTIEYFKVMLGVDVTRERVEQMLADSYPPIPRIEH